jgi:iron complex transport system ATP-binding protein
MGLLMKAPLFEIKDLSLSISKNKILSSVSLNIYEGEYLSIIGPNGAGKTTLLKCLMRIFTGIQGTVLLKGTPIENLSQKNIARHISYVPQSNGRFFPFTVEEFVMMARYPHLSPFTSINLKDKTAVHDALTLTNTSRFAERQMDTLSGGEKQAVFIAAALAQGSKILLLDEPTTFLDPKHEADIYKILKRINRDFNRTVVSVTHDINSAVLQSDRIAILKNGKIIFCGTPGDVMNNNILQQAYEKSFTFIEYPGTGQLIIAPEVVN